MDPYKNNVKRFGKCKYCGAQHVFNKASCLALGNICGLCKKKDHFEFLCPSKNAPTSGVTSANGADDLKKEAPKRVKPCMFCGNVHIHGKHYCPAYGRFCSYCGVTNHAEKICPKKKHDEMAKKSVLSLGTAMESKSEQVCTYCQDKNCTDKLCLNMCVKGNVEPKDSINDKMSKMKTEPEKKDLNKNVLRSTNALNTMTKTFKPSSPFIRNVALHNMQAMQMAQMDQRYLPFNHNLPFNNNVPQLKKWEKKLGNPQNKKGQNKTNNISPQPEKLLPGNLQEKEEKRKIPTLVIPDDNAEESSSGSDNELNLDKKKKKSEMYSEIANYYIMWQEYKKSLDYLVKAKLCHSTEEIDKKLMEVTKLMMESQKKEKEEKN